MKLPQVGSTLRQYCGKAIAVTASVTLVLNPVIAAALPQGGIVSAGQANIADGAGRVDINQVSDKAVIDWRGPSVPT